MDCFGLLMAIWLATASNRLVRIPHRIAAKFDRMYETTCFFLCRVEISPIKFKVKSNSNGGRPDRLVRNRTISRRGELNRCQENLPPVAVDPRRGEGHGPWKGRSSPAGAHPFVCRCGSRRFKRICHRHRRDCDCFGYHTRGRDRAGTPRVWDVDRGRSRRVREGKFERAPSDEEREEALLRLKAKPCGITTMWNPSSKKKRCVKKCRTSNGG